jgi:hypothetical protein
MGLRAGDRRDVRPLGSASRRVRPEHRRTPQTVESNSVDRAVTHRLVGYDRTTGRVAVEHEITAVDLAIARRVAGVGADDPDAVLCYALDRRQADEIAAAIGAPTDVAAFDFYLEGFAT